MSEENTANVGFENWIEGAPCLLCGNMDDDKAYLSNDKDLIRFQYGRQIIRFRGPYSLEYFTSVKDWDNGYIIVMAKYRHNQEPEEEYIDLVPILKNLYIDAFQFHI